MGIGGQIKQRIEDFVVEEIPPKLILHQKLEKKMHGKEKHTVFWMEKFNWDTYMAIKEIAKRLHVSIKRFGFAGVKDKRALTRQRVSVKGVSESDLKKIKIKGIRLYGFSSSKKRIKLGELEGNKFTIVIRNLDLSEKELKKKINLVFKRLGRGIPNLFGPQRFGEVRPLTHLVGLAMLKGDFEGAAKLYLAKAFENEPEDVKKIRKSLWENWGKKQAYKNALKEFPKRLKYERAVLDYLVKNPKDFCGALRRMPVRLRKLFINAVQAEIWNKSVKGEKFKINQKVPLPGFDTKLNLKVPVEKKMKRIMDRMGISIKDFKMVGMPEVATSGGNRNAILIPKDLKLIEVGEDDINKGKKKVKISFILPPGAYATVVLKEIIN